MSNWMEASGQTQGMLEIVSFGWPGNALGVPPEGLEEVAGERGS